MRDDPSPYNPADMKAVLRGHRYLIEQRDAEIASLQAALAAERTKVDRLSRAGGDSDTLVQLLRDDLSAERAAHRDTRNELDATVEATSQVTDALAAAEQERDLARAHDQQPYPTAEAYERVCDAIAAERAKVAALSTDLVQGQLHAPGCPYVETDPESECTCPRDELAARWKARWVLSQAELQQVREAHAKTREEVSFWQAEAVNARVEGAVLIAEAGTMPRCGNCRDWKEGPEGFGWCDSVTSMCFDMGLWPADHGCPSHRAKPEASYPGRAPHLHADGTATEEV